MLRLTKKADYSLIALKHFAMRQRANGAALSAKEVAEQCGIPLPVTSKLLQKLGKSGFLVSEFGTHGGYRLARDPQLISALEVICAIDGPIVLAECFTEEVLCGHSTRCTVKRPLRRIHEGILRLLQSVSVQDMLQDSEDEPDPAHVSPLIALQAGANSPEGHRFLGTPSLRK
jgi:FeS assembly SUF system regulator